MDFGSYPPRFKIDVRVNNRSFFSAQQCLKLNLMGGKKILQKNIAIAAAYNGMFFSLCGGLKLSNVVSFRYTLKYLIAPASPSLLQLIVCIQIAVFIFAQ